MIRVELNEAGLIEKELTVRNLRLSKEVLETRRSAIRWLALSMGIINPGESRLGSLAVLDSMVYFQFIKRHDPSVKEMTEYINASWEKINEKTLRYHLLRMKKTGLIENSKGRFYFRPPGYGDRFDPSVWSKSVFESFYNEVSDKIGQVIGDMKGKNALNSMR